MSKDNDKPTQNAPQAPTPPQACYAPKKDFDIAQKAAALQASQARAKIKSNPVQPDIAVQAAKTARANIAVQAAQAVQAGIAVQGRGDTASVSNKIVMDLVNFAKDKELANQIGSHNALELRNKVEACEQDYVVAAPGDKATVLKAKLEKLQEWSKEKEKETQKPAWKKIGSAIFSGVMAVRSLIKGNLKGAQEHCAKMTQSLAELSGKSKDFAKGLRGVQEKTKTFAEKARDRQSQTGINPNAR